MALHINDKTQFYCQSELLINFIAIQTLIDLRNVIYANMSI